jgi:hypothetical protein
MRLFVLVLVLMLMLMLVSDTACSPFVAKQTGWENSENIHVTFTRRNTGGGLSSRRQCRRVAAKLEQLGHNDRVAVCSR